MSLSQYLRSWFIQQTKSFTSCTEFICQFQSMIYLQRLNHTTIFSNNFHTLKPSYSSLNWLHFQLVDLILYDFVWFSSLYHFFVKFSCVFLVHSSSLFIVFILFCIVGAFTVTTTRDNFLWYIHIARYVLVALVEASVAMRRAQGRAAKDIIIT